MWKYATRYFHCNINLIQFLTSLLQVVHSITDILNDIVEHFKVPDVDFDRRPSRKLSCKENNTSDLWEPKKMEGYVCKVR